jgi:hypothetical protein
MKSRTLSPFRTTNLVVVQANGGACGSKGSDFFACGDALLIDPGCCSQVHTEVRALSKIISYNFSYSIYNDTWCISYFTIF